MTYKVELVLLDPIPVLYGRATCTTQQLGATYARLISASGQYALKTGAEMAGPPFSRCTDLRADDREVEAGIIVDREVPSSPDICFGYLTSGLHVMTLHVGPYERLGLAYEALMDWVQANGKEVIGRPFEFYVNDPADVSGPHEFETEVYFPIV